MTSFTETIFNSGNTGNPFKTTQDRLQALSDFDISQFPQDGNHHELYAAIATCFADPSAEVRKKAKDFLFDLPKKSIEFNMTATEFTLIHDTAVKAKEYNKANGYTQLTQLIVRKPEETEEIITHLNKSVRENIWNVEADNVCAKSVATAFNMGMQSDKTIAAAVIKNTWDAFDQSLPFPGYYMTKVVTQIATNGMPHLQSEDYNSDLTLRLSAISAYSTRMLRKYEKLENAKTSLESFKDANASLNTFNKAAVRKGQKIGHDRFLSFIAKQAFHKTANDIGFEAQTFNFPGGYLHTIKIS